MELFLFALGYIGVGCMVTGAVVGVFSDEKEDWREWPVLLMTLVWPAVVAFLVLCVVVFLLIKVTVEPLVKFVRYFRHKPKAVQ